MGGVSPDPLRRSADELRVAQFERHGVRVADVLPGAIDTPILTNTKNHSGDTPEGFRGQDNMPTEGPFRLMPPEAVAECVWH